MYWLKYELKCLGAVTQAKPMGSNTNRIIVTNTFSRETVTTTYNVLLRYLAYVSRCCSLLLIMLKIFVVICQLADDFREKSIFFHILVGFYPSNSVRAFSLLLLTICKWQFSVSGQIVFNRADKNKSTVSVFCLIFFSAMLYFMSDINIPDNSHD